MGNIFELGFFILGIYGIIGFIIFIVLTLLNFSWYYKNYLEINDTEYNLEEVYSLLTKELSISDPIIRIIQHNQPLFAFLSTNILPRQKNTKHTLLISSRFFEAPFDENDRRGFLYYIISQNRMTTVSRKQSKVNKPLSVLIIIITLYIVVGIIIPLFSFNWGVWGLITFVFYLLIVTICVSIRKRIFMGDLFALENESNYILTLIKVEEFLTQRETALQKLTKFVISIFGVKQRPSISERIAYLNDLTSSSIEKSVPIDSSGKKHLKLLYCPNCSQPLSLGIPRCPYCNSLLDKTSRFLILIWIVLVLPCIILIFTVFSAVLYNSYQNDTLIVFFYGLLVCFLIALFTDLFLKWKSEEALYEINFNPWQLTVILGLSLFVSLVIIVFLTRIFRVEDLLSVGLAYPMTSWVLGGFLIQWVWFKFRTRKVKLHV
ncbi:MAG: hypothetical protein ACFFDN_46185 [Candidatus Hodarchaeota archaeon]